MDFIVRASITANGIIEEECVAEMAKILREGYVSYPHWVDPKQVAIIRNLKCFEAVREMLLNGTPTIEVARQIHLLNELTEYKLASVRTFIEHFKTTLPKLEMIKRMTPHQPFAAAQRAVAKSLNAIEVLDRMIELMAKRIEIGMKKEIALEFLMPGMEKQFTVIKDLLVVQHEMKRDLSNKPDIEVGNGDRIDWSKIYSSPGVNEVMENPEKRARLVRMTENITKLYGTMSADTQQRVLDLAKQKLEDRA